VIIKTTKVVASCDCCQSVWESEYDSSGKLIAGEQWKAGDPDWGVITFSIDRGIPVETSLNLCPACARRSSDVDWRAEIGRLVAK
jgi:hypothetical protein